jgi:hypothetical protein
MFFIGHSAILVNSMPNALEIASAEPNEKYLPLGSGKT